MKHGIFIDLLDIDWFFPDFFHHAHPTPLRWSARSEAEALPEPLELVDVSKARRHRQDLERSQKVFPL